MPVSSIRSERRKIVPLSPFSYSFLQSCVMYIQYEVHFLHRTEQSKFSYFVHSIFSYIGQRIREVSRAAVY